MSYQKLSTHKKKHYLIIIQTEPKLSECLLQVYKSSMRVDCRTHYSGAFPENTMILIIVTIKCSHFIKSLYEPYVHAIA